MWLTVQPVKTIRGSFDGYPMIAPFESGFLTSARQLRSRRTQVGGFGGGQGSEINHHHRPYIRSSTGIFAMDEYSKTVY
jgi:hypothetical protein